MDRHQSGTLQGVPTRRQLAGLLGSGMAAAGALGSLSACSKSATDAEGSAPEPSAPRLRIAMITHGDDGQFWSVVKRGAADAAALTGVTLDYHGSADDNPAVQAKLITDALAGKLDGLAVSAPEADAIAPALEQARAKGIPAITLNSGLDSYATLGAYTHVGQDEHIAGRAAGQRLALGGAERLLCLIHQKNNNGLERRAAGAREGFGGGYKRLDVAGVTDWDTTARQVTDALRADTKIDAVLTLGTDICEVVRKALAEVQSKAVLATFDLGPEVLTALRGGTVAFAVDQQQYMQGYLPVLFLYLYNVNAATVGGGQPVLTGPSFADVSNAVAIERLIAQGTR